MSSEANEYVPALLKALVEIDARDRPSGPFEHAFLHRRDYAHRPVKLLLEVSCYYACHALVSAFGKYHRSVVTAVFPCEFIPADSCCFFLLRLALYISLDREPCQRLQTLAAACAFQKFYPGKRTVHAAERIQVRCDYI